MKKKIKDLTPLEALERLYCAGRLDLDYVINGRQKEHYQIVETALKEYERLKKLYKLEEETSKHLNDTVLLMNEEINKQLKALEIIKKKGIDIWAFYESKTCDDYNIMIEYHRPQPEYLQEQEFDFLKEVLK